MSRTYPYTEEPRDNRGTLITVDCRVAYNYSGQIAIGKVQSVRPAVITGLCAGKRASIKVIMEHPKRTTKQVSEVKDPKNVMVIFED